MSDAYIRRSAAIDLIRRHIGDLQTSREESLIAWVISTLRAMPAADVAPVVHGKWASEAKGGVYGPVCSVCGYYIPGISFWNAPYCPKCGARMDGGDDHAPD